jgi:hypothetical protein
MMMMMMMMMTMTTTTTTTTTSSVLTSEKKFSYSSSELLWALRATSSFHASIPFLVFTITVASHVKASPSTYPWRLAVPVTWRRCVAIVVVTMTWPLGFFECGWTRWTLHICFSYVPSWRSRDSSVVQRWATSWMTGGNFSLHHRVQSSSGAHPASYLRMGIRGWFPGGKVAGGIKLSTHIHLVPRSRMRGAIPPLPQYAFIALCSVKAKGQLYLYLLRFHMAFIVVSRSSVLRITCWLLLDVLDPWIVWLIKFTHRMIEWSYASTPTIRLQGVVFN